MPRIYRIMKVEGGKPKVGTRSAELGVRPGKDVRVDEAGQVRPGEGGMSVGPSLHDLPPLFVPRRLEHVVPGARGRNSHRCWAMGAGPYESASVAEDLRLRIDRDGIHGLVEPSMQTSIDAYQSALAATRDAWTDGEH